MGRSQQGNNNAYCQDNPLSWFDWNLSDADHALLAVTQRLLRIRREQPLLRRQKFFQGRPIAGHPIKDITWLRTDGEEKGEEEWQTSFIRALGARLAGDTLNAFDERGEPWANDVILFLMNAHYEDILFTLPHGIGDGQWDVLIDTEALDVEPGDRMLSPGDDYNVTSRSLALLSWRRADR
jgi:isoamylase